MCPPVFREEADAVCDRGQGQDMGNMRGDEPVSSQPPKHSFIISIEDLIIFLLNILVLSVTFHSSVFLKSFLPSEI